uniref:Integrase core domain containing protein n=1 Tax=Solanum tuberosum TaxID=4113 RepID=M1E1D4_SOLTU
MVAALVARFEIDFARMLLAEIHERVFRSTTTLPFPCIIFQLCRDVGVPIWHCHKLVPAIGTLDIGLIQDAANIAAPRRGPQIDVPALGADLVADVEQMQGEDPTPSAHIDDVPRSPSQAASRAPSSSRATPSSGSTIVPLARVQKFEAQMATLLYHVKPWMQRSISESKARMERKTEHMMDLKVQAVNKCMDAFELRVLE